MVWTRNKYPSSMKNLDSLTRDKAIEIANTLLDEQYDRDSAARIAIVQAKKWAEENDTDNDTRQYILHVVPHPEGWAVRRASNAKACFVFDTLSEAQNIAVEMSRQERGGVMIHDADGHVKNLIVPQPHYEGAYL